MIDPDLQKQLEVINTNLTEIKTKKGPGVWRAFFNGMFSALGYVAGLAVVVVILGWILQKTGLLKPFQEQVQNFTDIVSEAKKLIPADNTAPAQKSNSQNSGSGGESTITLPNGQQYKVNVAQ